MTIQRIKVDIPDERPYEVHLGSFASTWIGDDLIELGVKPHIMVLTDSYVKKQYFPALQRALESSGFIVDVVTVPAGENAKSVECASEIWQAMADCGLTRDCSVLAFGGGVVGDLTGFCASTFMRGLKVVQIPTTLLSMVDSSVGGKTAINLESGKNLVGTFCQPILVCADTSILLSLPAREWQCGCGEIVKSCVIDSQEFFDWLSNHSQELVERNQEVVQETIARCITFKAKIVAQDKTETAGVRECLNYGHTLAHAIETKVGYGTYSHGHAVAQGMRFAARLAVGLGLASLDFMYAQDNLLDKVGLYNYSIEATPQELLNIMKHDKKARSGSIRFVLPLGCGSWVVRELEDDVILQYLSAWLSSE